MGHVALILGDQLTAEPPALDGAARVVMVESWGRLGRRPLHRQRAHLVLSAMRHYAERLRADGWEVEVRRAPSIPEAVRALVDGGEEVRCAAPNDPSARRSLREAGARLLPASQFLVPEAEFTAWAEGRRQLRMEHFYRLQRQRFGVLLTADGEPEGGRWNFDQENRRPPAAGLTAPAPWRPREDTIDAQVRLDLREAEEAGRLHLWGDDAPRAYAITPEEAGAALDDFIAHRLAEFGPWQDAMVPGESVLFHSLLSVPLNLGVLHPLDAIRAAERAYREGRAPLQSAEGFIRQILGWREYVHGMAHLRRSTAWSQTNALDAQAPLPAAFWGAASGWACLDSTVDGVARTGYAHHIERLMVLGNTLLLAGVQPWEAVRWFQTAFVDGAEWVMAPNAAGMALYADGGGMTSKPYAAGGNYMRRMSRHCASCQFDPAQRSGERACPLSALYWDFLDRHRARLAANPRMGLAFRNLERIDDSELAAIRERAAGPARS